MGRPPSPPPNMAAAGKTAPLPSRYGGLGGGFLGARLPAAVGAMARGLRQLDRDTFRRLLAGTGPRAAAAQEQPPLCEAVCVYYELNRI